jgi:cyclic-di-GMP-binding protein
MEMPSFDISSEVDMVALKNAIDITGRQIANRYDFKGTSANVELNEKDKLITLYGDSDFQLDQIKDILLPGMEKKEPDSSKRLDHQDVQKVSGNKVKQELKIRAGIDTELAKKIVKMIKDSGLKVQASIQGDTVRVNGAKRDMLQDAIAFVKKNITDFPLQFGNFRD